MRFKDPTFVDMVVRRRANYKIANPDNKTRLCYLFADAITAVSPQRLGSPGARKWPIDSGWTDPGRENSGISPISP